MSSEEPTNDGATIQTAAQAESQVNRKLTLITMAAAGKARVLAEEIITTDLPRLIELLKKNGQTTKTN